MSLGNIKGIEPKSIFELDNYTFKNHEFDANKHKAIVNVLKRATDVGDECLQRH